MSTNKSKVQSPKSRVVGKQSLYCLLLAAYCLLSLGCRYDMQDQPRYKALKKNDFFNDKKAMRELPEGTVARGYLHDNKAFYAGKKDNVDSSIQPTTATDAAGNNVVTSFPDAIEKSPVPVTQELLDRGEQRYKVFCIVCHGPVGNGDGMVVRRGFPKPPTYHDDRLRGAPDGHFFDVISNGWGKMNSYGSQIPAADRWAIVAYIRALQISQNPNGNAQINQGASEVNQPPRNTVQNPQTQNAGGQTR